MSRKMPKIKRNSSWRTFGAAQHRRRVIVRILLIVLIAGAVFAIGWFAAQNSIDSISDFWYTYISPNGRPDSSQAESIADSSQSESMIDSSSLSESTADSSEQTTSPVTVDDSNGVWGEVPVSSLGSEQLLRSSLQSLLNAGANHAVVTLKDDDGYLYYDSAVALAQSADAVRPTADVEMYVRLCNEMGVIPCVRISAFRDSIAPYGDRTLAVHYLSDDMLWLDTSVDLGGKPWLNPYNAAARQYILDIAEEIARFGIRNVIFSNVQFPSGFSLDVCYYGADATQSKAQTLSECVDLFETTLSAKDIVCWFEWPLDATVNMQPLLYGEGGPATLGADRLWLTVNTTVLEDGTTAVPEYDRTVLETVLSDAAAQGTVSLGMDLTSLTDPALLNNWRSFADTLGFTNLDLPLTSG